MGRPWINAEGYFDLTAYTATNKIEKDNTISKEILEYIKKKYRMLTQDFLIFPTEKEMLHMFSLKSEKAIDKYAIKIILKHWDEE